MARLPLAAANWKMHKTASEARELAAAVVSGAAPCDNYGIILAPPFTAIPTVVEATRGHVGIGVAGQNCFWETQGAYTGEVAPGMLVAAGCSHVIIGHSERRQYFGETDATVAKRTRAALDAGLDVIVCIGETEAEREGGRTEAVLERQLNGGVGLLAAADWPRIVVAYEPVWAIGTGKTATPEIANDAHAFIRGWIATAQGPATAEATRILYGGSVKPDNTGGLIAQPDIDGGLVGGASLQADAFLEICHAIAAAEAS